MNAPDLQLPIYRRSEGVVAFSLVDRNDFGRLNKHKWYICYRGFQTYARRVEYRRGRQVNIFLHREVLNAKPDDPLIDHKNGNGLDNRKENLRFTNKSVNRINTTRVRMDSQTGVKGVTFDPRCGSYLVYMRRNGKKENFGSFSSLEEAAGVAKRIYDAASV